jgi:hypothetical protein
MKQVDNTDYGILIALLKEHIEGGSYWGVKAHHYKRCKNLLKKLEKQLTTKEL